MARFDAATAVEAMEFDFTAYGGEEGTIPEPTTGQVNEFMLGMRRLLNQAREALGSAEDTKEPDDMSPEELGEMMDTMEDNMAVAQEFTAQSIALTAALCSNHPGADDLAKLPMRVMRAFSKWLILQINPKEEQEQAAAAVRSLPAPQDRRPATKRSRKAGR